MSEWSEKTPGGVAQFVGRGNSLPKARHLATASAKQILPRDEGWTLWDEAVTFYPGDYGRGQDDEVVCTLAYARGDALDQLRHQATIARANAAEPPDSGKPSSY